MELLCIIRAQQGSPGARATDQLRCVSAQFDLLDPRPTFWNNITFSHFDEVNGGFPAGPVFVSGFLGGNLPICVGFLGEISHAKMHTCKSHMGLNCYCKRGLGTDTRPGISWPGQAPVSPLVWLTFQWPLTQKGLKNEWMNECFLIDLLGSLLQKLVIFKSGKKPEEHIEYLLFMSESQDKKSVSYMYFTWALILTFCFDGSK